VFVLVPVTTNAALVRASLIQITRTGTSTRTRVSVNVASHPDNQYSLLDDVNRRSHNHRR